MCDIITCLECNPVIAENTVTTTGNACPNGAKYAQDECLCPVRTVTATVRVANRKDTMVSVKTAVPVPKGSMMAVMDVLRKITVNAPLRIGDVLPVQAGGSEIVVTKTIL